MLEQRDTDLRLHGRVVSVDDGTVLLEVGSGDRIPVADPDGVCDPGLAGQSRTLEVRTTQCERVHLAPGADHGVRRVGDRADLVGEFLHRWEGPDRRTLRVGFGNFHPGHVPYDYEDRPDEHLPPNGYREDGDGVTVAALGVAFAVTDCYYVPALDPLLPRVASDARMEYDVGPTAEGRYPTLSLGLHDRDDDWSPADVRWILGGADERGPRVDLEAHLPALCGACERLLDGSSAVVDVGGEGDLRLTVVRDGVRYVQQDALRVTLMRGGTSVSSGLVSLLAFARAVVRNGQAAVDDAAAGSLPGAERAVDRLRLGVLRRGLGYLDDGTLIGPRDPVENYWGFCQGYARAVSGEYRSVDWVAENHPPEDVLSWARPGRNYDGGALEHYAVEMQLWPDEG